MSKEVGKLNLYLLILIKLKTSSFFFVVLFLLGAEANVTLRFPRSKSRSVRSQHQGELPRQGSFYIQKPTVYNEIYYATLKKKQRFYILFNLEMESDSFYDILWQWEKNHTLENWNFKEQYGEKIKNLVYCRDNMTYFLQFVKLFQEQLILVFNL
jgi:hypothetical protein